MASPEDIHELRSQRDAAAARALAGEAEVRALDRAIVMAERAGDQRAVTRLNELRASKAKIAEGARSAASRFGRDSWAKLGEWLEQTPEQIVGTCSTDHPFVLLPVRLETKFAPTHGGTELRVRMFPDDISIAAPPTALGSDEVDAGQAYWRARAAARLSADDAALRRAYEGAWTRLASRFGAYRGGFIVSATEPQNPGAAAGALVFKPPAAPTEPSLPRADALPDRFILLTYAADPTTKALREINRVVGLPIPDDLTLAPDAAEASSWLSRDEATGHLDVPDALKWLVDFDTAVAVGMAVRIPLAAPFDTDGFARVIALGLKTATPPSQGPATLEKLLSKHRYGDGCGLVRAGTPTNNTDSAASGWRPASSDAQQLFAIEDAPPDIAPKEGALGVTDGWRLCELLGLSSEFVRRLPNAAATDVAEALTMNCAATPGTLDNFVSDFLGGVVDAKTAASLHGFFTRWVSGRGHYPALRVGRQPYGLVLTSAWNNWKFPAPIASVEPALYELIDRHRRHWEILARRAPHAGTPAADPFQRLLSIIGLLASSTEFASHKAVSDEYIRQRLSFGGADAASVEQWFDALRTRRNQNLSAIQFPAVTGPTEPLLAFMVFLGGLDEWRLPIIDRDPVVPLSETAPIGPYDGVHNYLHWLTTASREDLASERFIGADGASVARPATLLYVLLRHAYLAALENSALAAAHQFGATFFDVLERDPLIANIGGQQHVLRKDYLEVDAARLGLAPQPVALAEWTLASARVVGEEKPASVQLLAEVHAAIGALATLPTARLERLLAEHLDLCSYRLDAWITALYAQRLAQRNARDEARALHLGAFGWVENLRPAGAERQRLSLDALPEALRQGAGPTLFDESANGGYVHAPSLAQASTAAVLRNGYLSHASAAQSLPFAVDLSSARMRQALALTRGVRNGQPIAALLGYQFERGLHEGYPGVELDSFIFVLRDRFPLIAGRLTDLPEGTLAESVEARNVVDGLSLLEFTDGKSYPYGLANLAEDGSSAASAIAAEVNRARDALDAVSDLLLAESVHQATQGNIARTKASLQALTEPEAPPEPEVIRTPRSGRVLTFRVALALDANASSGWTSAQSPRALANPHLNHWLAQHLPKPGQIQWTVADGGAPAAARSFAALALEPIDLVLMSGDRLGDGSSELERYLVRHYRSDAAVPDERISVVAPATLADAAQSVVFDFRVAAPDAKSLASIHPLLVRMRRLLTRARPAHARDFRRSADVAQAEPTDPTGTCTGHPKLVAFKDLTERLDATSTALGIANGNLKAKLAALAPLLTQLASDPASIANPAWPPALEALRRALFVLVGYGLPEAVPADGLTVTAVLVDRLAGQAQAVAKAVEKRLATASDLRATAFAEPLPAEEPTRANEIARRNGVLYQNYLDTARALLGSAFSVIPLYRFQPAQATELKHAIAVPVVSDPHVVDEWIHSVARVHMPLADLTWAGAVARWNGHPIGDPAVLQLPHRPGTPWIGGQFGGVLPPAEWLSLVVFNAAVAGNPLQAGLLIDAWTETVPTDKETTGISFNFNRPNATAPQAILIAVPPALTGSWAWDDLVASVHEALDLAHLRAVEPDALIGRNAADTPPVGDYFQALPALLSEFTNARFATVDYANRVNVALAPGS